MLTNSRLFLYLAVALGCSKVSATLPNLIHSYQAQTHHQVHATAVLRITRRPNYICSADYFPLTDRVDVTLTNCAQQQMVYHLHKKIIDHNILICQGRCKERQGFNYACVLQKRRDIQQETGRITDWSHMKEKDWSNLVEIMCCNWGCTNPDGINHWERRVWQSKEVNMSKINPRKQLEMCQDLFNYRSLSKGTYSGRVHNWSV